MSPFNKRFPSFLNHCIVMILIGENLVKSISPNDYEYARYTTLEDSTQTIS